MDKIVEKILSSSSTENDLKQLKLFLLKEESSLSKYLNNIDDALNSLDLVQHSLGYAFLLAAKVSSPKFDPKNIGQVHRFIRACNAVQIRMVPYKFIVLARKVAEVARETKQPITGVKTLQIAVTKLRSSSESLTPIHSEFVLLCLLSKTYNSALPILEEEIFETSSDAGNTSRDVLLYYYYGGIAYIGAKDLKKALHFLKLAITIPASVLSAIMIEAYKKLILVSLLLHGRAPSLPRYTSNALQRHLKTAFPQYQEFANAYSTYSTDDLHKVAETYAEVFQKDKNFGLVKQCIQSLYRRNIQRLTQTYITLSLQDIATAVKLNTTKEVEKYLLNMIEAGEIYAVINQKDGMVSFSDDPEKYNSSKTLGRLDNDVQKVFQLTKRVRTMDETIATSISYIQRTLMERGGRGGPDMGPEDFSDGADKFSMGAPPKAV